jgi:hypothetical protein
MRSMRSSTTRRLNAAAILPPSTIAGTRNQFARTYTPRPPGRPWPHFRVSSINEVICHGIPDKRKMRDGDIVNIGTSQTHPSWDHETCETEPEETPAVNPHVPQTFLSTEMVRGPGTFRPPACSRFSQRSPCGLERNLPRGRRR